MSSDISMQLQAQVLEAYNNKTPLKIQAGNSKAFYGRQIDADLLDISDHQGIISYEPTELVITARAGTRLSEIESTLMQNNQMLAFEPPAFADNASLGGTIACGFSGPRRAYAGAARDYVLGCNMINGRAEKLKFGGQVMKNVAGYDASRLMCGAMGTLGVLLELSLKVVPLPEYEVTLSHKCDPYQALQNMHRWKKLSYPISASCFDGKDLHIRLSGNESAVTSAQQAIGGDILKQASAFWLQLKEQTQDFFNSDKAIWRLSLASNAPPLNLPGDSLYEWGGALRWLKTDEPADRIRDLLASIGGHATLFRNNINHVEAQHPLSEGVFKIHKKLKHAFDPENILNPGRLYKDL